METVIITQEGQITIPQDIRDSLHLQAGVGVNLVIEDNRLIIEPKHIKTDEVFGLLEKKKSSIISEDEMQDGLRKSIARQI